VTPMNTLPIRVSISCIVLALTISLFAHAKQPAAAAPQNLLPGIGPLLQSSGASNWSGLSILENIPGTSLYPITSPTTVLYIGFIAGTRVDIGNMVLYTTPRENSTITAITPVTLKGVSNPEIHLTHPRTCPNQPLSATSPCIIRLDPIQLSLSTLNDYYLAVYFTKTDDDTHVARPRSFIGSLSGGEEVGDDTQLPVGASVPSLLGNGNSAPPSFLLVAVMNN
jgi:hypothetical protein